MDKEVWYIYTMDYYSAIKRNAFESVLMRWMKLEPIMQSEVSQKQKDKPCILTHKQYRTEYQDLRDLRAEIQYCQHLVDQCRHRLLTGVPFGEVG